MKIFMIFLGVFAVIFAVAIIFAAGNGGGDGGSPAAGNNVRIENGKQIVEIRARGGYFPGVSAASAEMPTVLRVKTQGTFDCSSALVIPSIGYRKNLPPTGSVDVNLPAQKPGSVLRGLCSMGMYNFEVRFN